MLKFNKELHQYSLNGVVIPSVTQVLEVAGLSNISKVDPEVLKRNSLFGEAVHKTIELYCKGTLDVDNLDPILSLYLDGWISFVEDFGYKVDKFEHQGYHPIYRYGFTIDQEGEITKGKYIGKAIGDIKTGCVMPSHKYQLNGGYRLAVGNVNTFLLYLNPEFIPNGYKVIFAKDSKREQGVFLSALTIYNIKKEEGLL